MRHTQAMILADVEARQGGAAQFDAQLKLHLLLQPLGCDPGLRRQAQRLDGGPSTAAQWEWELKPARRWLDAGPAGPRVLCIEAGAGEGKSALAAALCAPEAGAISAWHFARAEDARSLDPACAVRTLAYQLGCRWVGGWVGGRARGEVMEGRNECTR